MYAQFRICFALHAYILKVKRRRREKKEEILIFDPITKELGHSSRFYAPLSRGDLNVSLLYLQNLLAPRCQMPRYCSDPPIKADSKAAKGERDVGPKGNTSQRQCGSAKVQLARFVLYETALCRAGAEGIKCRSGWQTWAGSFTCLWGCKAFSCCYHRMT